MDYQATSVGNTAGEDAVEGPLPQTVAGSIEKLLARGSEWGYVTYDELSATLPLDQLSSEEIEDTMTMLSELGITVTESDESEEPAAPEGEPAKARGNLDHDDIGRTDDPVRMYLREMRSVQLLSREGEVAIAKRIEAGRETMLGAIRESPLTFDAILGWRDALNEGKMLLRDIIDLNAAHGDGGFDSAVFVTPGEMVATPAAGCVTASKDQSAAETVEIGTELGVAEAKEGESSIPLAAMEAALMLDITVTFDAMAQTQEKLDKLRHQRITNLGKREVLPRPTECRYDKLKFESIELLKRVRLNNTRIEHLVEQLYELNRRLVGEEGKLLRLAESAGVKRLEFLQHYMGSELEADWLERVAALLGRGWTRLVEKKDDVAQHRAVIAQIATEVKLPIAEFRRVVQIVQRGEREASRAQEGDGRGEPAVRRVNCQEVQETRPAIPRPDPGGQYWADEGGRQIRIPSRVQVLDLRHLVDPPSDHPLDRPGAHDPHSGAHDRGDETAASNLAANVARDRPRADPRGARREARDVARKGAQGAGDRQGTAQP